MNKKIIITVVLIVLIVGGFWVWKNNQEKVKMSQQQNQSQNEKQAQNQQTEVNTSDWKTYRNEKYGFEMKYPDTFLLKESDEIQWKEAGIIVQFSVFDEKNRDLEGKKNPGYFMYMNVAYWDDINNKYAKGGSRNNEPHYENLDDLFADKDSFVKKGKEIKIDGIKAYNVTRSGYEPIHGVMIEYNNGVYRVEFSPFVQNPPSDVIKEKILSSFKFI